MTEHPAMILEVNQRTALVYGYGTAELVGKPPAYLLTALLNEIATIQG